MTKETRDIIFGVIAISAVLYAIMIHYWRVTDRNFRESDKTVQM